MPELLLAGAVDVTLGVEFLQNLFEGVVARPHVALVDLGAQRGQFDGHLSTDREEIGRYRGGDLKTSILETSNERGFAFEKTNLAE